LLFPFVPLFCFPFAPSSFALFVHRDLLPKSLPQFKPFEFVSLKCSRGMWTKKKENKGRTSDAMASWRGGTAANSRSEDGASSGRKKRKKRVVREQASAAD